MESQRCLGGHGFRHLDRLLATTDADAVVSHITEQDMENVVRSFHAANRLGEIRRWLVDRSAKFAAEAQTQAQAAVVSDGAVLTIQSVLRRLRHTTDEAERASLRRSLLDQAERQAAAEENAKQAAKAAVKSGRALINIGLAAACALEKSGMGADVLVSVCCCTSAMLEMDMGSKA